MDDLFQIPVVYKDKELLFPARLITKGYIHQFLVEVFEQEFVFEQDDSGDYRALVDTANLDQAKKTDVELLKAIAAAIETILK